MGDGLSEPRGPLAGTYEQLGEGMRRLRLARGWSRQEVVARLGRIAQERSEPWALSATSLQRFESGRGQRPRLAHADALDEAYAANQWISLSLAQLSGARWQPWTDLDWPKTTHHVGWPAALSSSVWVHVRPSAHNAGVLHVFLLTWRHDARRQHTAILPAEGEYWVLDKPSYMDARHADLRITELQQPVHVLHGLGSPPRHDIEQVDLSSGWTVE